jgi:hypothetical protein
MSPNRSYSFLIEQLLVHRLKTQETTGRFASNISIAACTVEYQSEILNYLRFGFRTPVGRFRKLHQPHIMTRPELSIIK